MISVDTNVLLYAFRGFEPDHLVAKQTLETLLSQKESVAFTDIVINEFIIRQIVEIGFTHIGQEIFEIQRLASLRPNIEGAFFRVSPKMSLGSDNVLAY